MEHYAKVRKYFSENPGINVSRRKLARKLGLTKAAMKNAMYLLKQVGVVQLSNPYDVGSMKQIVAVYRSV